MKNLPFFRLILSVFLISTISVSAAEPVETFPETSPREKKDQDSAEMSDPVLFATIRNYASKMHIWAIQFTNHCSLLAKKLYLCGLKTQR